MSGPLAGVKVLDLSRYQNGPHATLMMADYGADILKLEHTQVRCALELRCAPRPSDRVPLRAQGGDPGRNNRLADGFQWYHEAFNRGKRSMALDLRHPEAKELFHKLVECAPGCLP